VRGLTAGQKGPRRHRFGVAVPGCIAKADHPGILVQQEIQNRGQKGRILCRAGQIRKRRPGGRQELRQQLVPARKLAQRLQSQQFGSLFP
jgi:hypothetical protein